MYLITEQSHCPFQLRPEIGFVWSECVVAEVTAKGFRGPANPLKNGFQNPLAVAISDLQKSSGPLATASRR